MGEMFNSKIIGATMVGLGLILGAYTISTFGNSELPSEATTAYTTAPQERVAIAVTDNDNNGVEDWRDEFISTPDIMMNDASSTTFVAPETLTGKTAFDLIENLALAKQAGPLASTPEEQATNILNQMVSATEQKIYGVADIDIMEEWDDEDVVNYANTIAASILANSTPGHEHEVDTLLDIVNSKNLDRMSEIEQIATIYKSYRDDALLVPVPKILAKEHLDLINVFEAMHTDITSMQYVFSDPAQTLMRLKRYKDDVAGLQIVLQNIFEALLPYVDLFTPEDPAALFVTFSSDYQDNL